MKITTTTKLTQKEKDFTRIAFIEKGAERVVSQKGIATLEVVSKNKKHTPRTLRLLARHIVQLTKKYQLKEVALEIDSSLFPKCSQYGKEWFWSTLAENFLLADYAHTKYKSKKPTQYLKHIVLVTSEKEARPGISKGSIIAEYTNICRDIANTTGGDMTPAALAQEAKKHCKLPNTKVTVLDLPAIKKLKMGGLIGVGQGAKDKPKFIVVEYNGLKNGSKEKPIVFVGKGITFDTGGLQIKPGMAMYEMHMDMSGGAAVIGALGAISKLGLKKHVIGLIPAAENSVGEDAIRPGDVLTMMNGKTVEVLHTDAEGRLVLADALHYAKRYEPKLVIDVATLTGASLVAVGQHANVILTKDRNLEDTLRDFGEESGDYTFPLPLWDEYSQYMKGIHADLVNLPQNDRYGGTIHGAAFLTHFVEKMKWAHIDMAPRMTSVPSDKLAKGATGEPTRLLVKIAESY